VTLYDAASTLPTYQASTGTVRLLHVSDLHLSPSSYPLIKGVAAQFKVDLVLDTGDVTDHGSIAEDGYVDAVAGLGVPYVYVRGNHDSAGTEAAVRRQPGAVVLDDGALATVAGLTIMGQADPRFTPDKRTQDDTAPETELRAVGQHLAELVQRQGRPPDVVAVHDPVSAQPLLGKVPLVLAGHTHARAVTEKDGTRLMVEGSTGGAGLRALEGDEPTPVEMSVLYLDGATGALQAYDEITLGGLGLSDARIRRQVVPPG
jgi:predicted MPP superfamily phosphohydrolase